MIKTSLQHQVTVNRERPKVDRKWRGMNPRGFAIINQGDDETTVYCTLHWNAGEDDEAIAEIISEIMREVGKYAPIAAAVESNGDGE